MNPDLIDPMLCICGEMMQKDEEFCTSECAHDFYDVQYLSHLQAQENWWEYDTNGNLINTRTNND